MYYYSLNRYLRETFGEKIYKIALNAKVTCPNRDGTLSDQGCIFCSLGGSGEFAPDNTLTVTEQIELAKLRVQNKIKQGKYIAYFQSFTNTYGDVRYLEKVFTEAAAHPEVAVLSVATRPDCLGQEVLTLLDRLNKIKPVWVELGLQTIHEETAEYINRCYALPVYDQAVKKLKAIGVSVITHLILGLPGETKEQMLESAFYAGQVTDGIKLQLLHVLKGTRLQKAYEEHKFQTLDMESYIDILAGCIELLPPHVVIHRLTGDGDKKQLIAPLWSADKKRVLNEINRVFTQKNTTQGNKLKFLKKRT